MDSFITFLQGAIILEGKKEYLKKYSTEKNVVEIINTFQQVKSKLKPPQNDIDWWIKRPFSELEEFINSFDTRNRAERKSEKTKEELEDAGAVLLGLEGEYEVWYSPNYEGAQILGRNYKNRPTHWCITSDDPEWWYDKYEFSEFIFLIRQTLKHDNLDKIAIDLEDGGRYFNIRNIVVWDLNDEKLNIEKYPEIKNIIQPAWMLFHDSGLTRDRYNTGLVDESIETKVLFFHGSKEPKLDRFSPPSVYHPFYITKDLHYAMAFCGKNYSSTGAWEIEKNYNSNVNDNYCYLVTITPSAKFFDFRNQKNADFKFFTDIISPEIYQYVQKIFERFQGSQTTDIYEFVSYLDNYVIDSIIKLKTFKEYISHYNARKIGSKNLPLMSEAEFEIGKKIINKLNITDSVEYTHERMADIFKELKKAGFHGIIANESDHVDDGSFAQVTTTYAIGIWDKAALDLISLVPMRYKWLKKINPVFNNNITPDSSYKAVQRYITLYKSLSKK